MEIDLIRRVAPVALAARNNIDGIPRQRGGCGRVYIEFSDRIRKGSKVAKAFEAAGFKMFPRPHFSGVRIYVGYDNATGKEWAEGVAIAKVFKDAGIPCYVDGDGD